MNGYRILALLGIACLLLAALIPVASARFATPEGPNAGINIGDTVFLGERNVNFSAFADPEKGDPVRMVRLDDSGQQTDPIAITNNIANYIRGSLGQYYPVYTDGTYDKEKYCLVQDVASSLGQMEVHISETDVEPQENPCRPGTIPYRMMAVQFLLPDLNLPFSEFQSSWYDTNCGASPEQTKLSTRPELGSPSRTSLLILQNATRLLRSVSLIRTSSPQAKVERRRWSSG